MIPTSNQAGRQASNRKRGDEIKKRHIFEREPSDDYFIQI
jgi:hypothetical protein